MEEDRQGSKISEAAKGRFVSGLIYGHPSSPRHFGCPCSSRPTILSSLWWTSPVTVLQRVLWFHWDAGNIPVSLHYGNSSSPGRDSEIELYLLSKL